MVLTIMLVPIWAQDFICWQQWTILIYYIIWLQFFLRQYDSQASPQNVCSTGLVMDVIVSNFNVSVHPKSIKCLSTKFVSYCLLLLPYSPRQERRSDVWMRWERMFGVMDVVWWRWLAVRVRFLWCKTCQCVATGFSSVPKEQMGHRRDFWR